jgi:hypothetical protein
MPGNVFSHIVWKIAYFLAEGQNMIKHGGFPKRKELSLRKLQNHHDEECCNHWKETDPIYLKTPNK